MAPSVPCPCVRRQMLLYMALAPEERLTYKEGGPAAEARFDAGVAGYEARAFRGCGIFVGCAAPRTLPLNAPDRATDRPYPPARARRPYEVSDDADSVQISRARRRSASSAS